MLRLYLGHGSVENWETYVVCVCAMFSNQMGTTMFSLWYCTMSSMSLYVFANQVTLIANGTFSSHSDTKVLVVSHCRSRLVQLAYTMEKKCFKCLGGKLFQKLIFVVLFLPWKHLGQWSDQSRYIIQGCALNQGAINWKRNSHVESIEYKTSQNLTQKL